MTGVYCLFSLNVPLDQVTLQIISVCPSRMKLQPRMRHGRDRSRAQRRFSRCRYTFGIPESVNDGLALERRQVLRNREVRTFPVPELVVCAGAPCHAVVAVKFLLNTGGVRQGRRVQGGKDVGCGRGGDRDLGDLERDKGPGRFRVCRSRSQRDPGENSMTKLTFL